MTRKKDRPMERAFLPVYVGRYLRKTRRFKAIHHGAYTLLLYTLWEEGGSLPYDLEELRALACVDRRSWPSVWAVIGPFFTIHDGRISQHTMTEVLEDFDAKRRSHVEGGKRSGAKHAEKMRETKARAQAKPEDSLSSKAKGFASPLQGERQSLSAEARKQFADALTGQYLERRCQAESLAAVRDALVEQEGPVFRVSEPCSDARDWETIRRYLADVHRIRLELAEQRVLRFPAGGAR